MRMLTGLTDLSDTGTQMAFPETLRTLRNSLCKLDNGLVNINT